MEVTFLVIKLYLCMYSLEVFFVNGLLKLLPSLLPVERRWLGIGCFPATTAGDTVHLPSPYPLAGAQLEREQRVRPDRTLPSTL